LGIPGFWLDGKSDKLDESQKQSLTLGTLEEVIPWLESLPDPEGQIDIKDVRGVLGTLSATPAVLKQLTDNMDDKAWKIKASAQDLSVLELISHLLDVEAEINAPRIELVLSEENPFVAGIDSDPWVFERRYQTARSPQVISDFMAQRQNAIAKLSALTDAEWLRPARHSFFGPTTLFELVRFIAIHDIDHIRQVFSLIQG
jgi:hypothetical protein